MLSIDNVWRFCSRRLEGKPLNVLPHLAQLGRRVVATMQAVRRVTFTALAAAEMFGGLTPQQIERLHERMARRTVQVRRCKRLRVVDSIGIGAPTCGCVARGWQEGETIFVPHGWWHAVLNIGEGVNMAITQVGAAPALVSRTLV